jgi:hypothetical protein
MRIPFVVANDDCLQVGGSRGDDVPASRIGHRFA